MVLFCQKMVEQYQKVKNLYSRKKFDIFLYFLFSPFHSIFHPFASFSIFSFLFFASKFIYDFKSLPYCSLLL